jgi:hypothetical protein
MRVILTAGWDLVAQALAAQKAIDEGIKDGDLWGYVSNGKAIGVKANKGSIRVYPPEQGA